LLPVGITGVGAAYAVALSFRSGTVDPRAPFVAAGLFLAVECAYWSLGSSAGRPNRRTVGRRVLLACAGAIAAALVGALVLVAASDSTRGVGFEAVGVAAALAILLLVAAISSRTKIRS
jgi:hypothetical protein